MRATSERKHGQQSSTACGMLNIGETLHVFLLRSRLPDVTRARLWLNVVNDNARPCGRECECDVKAVWDLEKPSSWGIMIDAEGYWCDGDRKCAFARAGTCIVAERSA